MNRETTLRAVIEALQTWASTSGSYFGLKLEDKCKAFLADTGEGEELGPEANKGNPPKSEDTSKWSAPAPSHAPCPDGGACHHACTPDLCARRDELGCAPLSSFGTEWPKASPPPLPSGERRCVHGRAIQAAWYHTDDWSECPVAPPLPSGEREVGWVIEKQGWYWRGNGPNDWTWKHQDALRFARRTDAECMQTWHLNGNGNVTEHAPSITPNINGYIDAVEGAPDHEQQNMAVDRTTPPAPTRVLREHPADGIRDDWALVNSGSASVDRDRSTQAMGPAIAPPLPHVNYRECQCAHCRAIDDAWSDRGDGLPYSVSDERPSLPSGEGDAQPYITEAVHTALVVFVSKAFNKSSGEIFNLPEYRQLRQAIRESQGNPSNRITPSGEIPEEIEEPWRVLFNLATEDGTLFWERAERRRKAKAAILAALSERDLRLDQARDTIDDLTQDMKRMDWFEAKLPNVSCTVTPQGGPCVFVGLNETFRQALDAARLTSEQKDANPNLSPNG